MLCSKHVVVVQRPVGALFMPAGQFARRVLITTLLTFIAKPRGKLS